jgi:uncharacterized protein (DUF58 family)
MMVPTQLGRYLGLFGLCFFLIGFVHASAIMYQVCLFCFGVLLTGAVLSFRTVRNLRCERELPAHAVYSGDPVEGKIRIIEERSRWRMLEIFDEHTNLISGMQTRRRMTLMTEGRGVPAVVAGTRTATHTHGRGQTIEVRDVVRFARRGLYRLGPITIHGYDPFGLLFQPRVMPVQRDLIVYPRPLPMSELAYAAGGVRRQVEVRPVGRAGESADFHGIRPYVQGDDLRRVHWKATAHSGKLAIKQFEYRASGAVQVILDLHAGKHYGEKEYSSLEAAITLAASVINHVVSNGNSVGLVATGAQITSLSPESGDRQLHRALETLALAKDDGAISLAHALAGQQTQVNRRCATVVITADADLALVGALLALRGRSAQVLLVLLDPRSFYEAELADRPKPTLLSIATTPLDLKRGLDGLAHGRHRLPDPGATAALAAAATASGVDVYTIGANLPLHQALQGIRMRM